MTAAEVDISETFHSDHAAQTHFDMQGVTLTLDGSLGALDTDRFVFDEGSQLLIADEDGSSISVRKDAREALRADNQVIGRDGDDRLIGGRGDDKLVGNGGDDRLFGARGDDLISGGAGDDRLVGNRGQDILDGGAGNDRLLGQSGADALHGGSGQDVLKGGRGDDRLTGGEDDDKLFGGRGADTFVFVENGGCDTIIGFDNGRDVIDLTAFGLTFEDLVIANHGRKNVIAVTHDDVSFWIKGADALLAEDDFLL